MTTTTLPGGTFTMGDDLTVTRMGYGAMQLAGPGVFGPPADRDAAVAVLRRGRRAGHQPHRHQRLLRPLRHQRDHPGGPAPLPGLAAPRDQGRRAARRRGRLAPRALARAAAPGRARQPRPPRAGGSRPRQPARRWLRRGRAGLPRRALHRARRAAAAGPDQAPRRQHRERRPGRRGAVDRAGRVRAELLQPGAPGRRRADRLTRRAGHRLRAVLPAGRLQQAAVRHAERRRRPVWRAARCPSRWRGCSSGRRTSC